jgi:hypothetical protein
VSSTSAAGTIPAGNQATTDRSQTAAAPGGGGTAPGGGQTPPPEAPWRSRWRRVRGPVLIGVLLVVGIGAGLAAGYALFDEPDQQVSLPAVAPTVVIEEAPEAEAAEQIGFPAFATRNTTRVGGVDPTSDAAGVALASYPAVGGVGGPRMVVIAPESTWQASLVATSLTADPVGAPILLGTGGEIPGFTAEALAGLSPTGLKRADGLQVLGINGVATPDGLETTRVNADDPAILAKEIDRQRIRLSGRDEPDHILVVSSEDPAMAMPAAAWAARSGDPIVFASGDEVPQATLDVIERHSEAPVYVLGPEQTIGSKAIKELRKAAGRAIRVGDPDPVVNAIEFARFIDGSFGWNINDPGHGFILANTARPGDAAAAAPLAVGGKPGPLLLTDSAERLPRPLQSFLLDTKPGFAEDPTRAVYNHVWLLGDTSAVSLGVQAQIDALTELERVSRGSGVPQFGPDPGTPESEPDPATP